MLSSHDATFLPFARDFEPKMGQAVAERTILRRMADRSWETWGDVARRVALGNVEIMKNLDNYDAKAACDEFEVLRRHIAKATILMSGRHLQHGDVSESDRNLEIFTNCSTSATSFALFLLLMSGSGVGRCYDDDMILVDWDNAPNLRCVLSHEHADFDWSAHESVRDALHKYGKNSKHTVWFEVPDSREGWAQALEVWETMTFEKIHKDRVLVLDFSKVRPKGSPIRGMQDRPASGPVPVMNAFLKVAGLKGSCMPPWKQAMYVDHYFSECVLVGGARRSARMSVKYWKEPDIIEFIQIKRPVEFEGLTLEEVVALRKIQRFDSFLWSSNNSVLVDKEFWDCINGTCTDRLLIKHAKKVWRAVTACSYGDGTGEPGLINIDRLAWNGEGFQDHIKEGWFGSNKYQPQENTEIYLKHLARRASKKKYPLLVNPCGEILLSVLGAFCTIADVVPFHADTLEEIEEAFRLATRALIRVNTLDSIYKGEVKRTNRIGVAMTGVHEFAWKFFRAGFRDLVNPDFSGVNFLGKDQPDPRIRAAEFWRTLRRFNRAVEDEAVSYSAALGVVAPHTRVTIKPSGTVSKLFGLTEGWHLPSMAFYLRWVQFRIGDPLVEEYQKNGYPVRELKQYKNTVIVGFPTAPALASIMPPDKMVTAGQATPEEQYTWLHLGEDYWLGHEGGNQISYTLKYDPEKVDFKHFCAMIKKHQPTIRCCSVLPQEDESSYEYMPEEAISKGDYEALLRAIEVELDEEVDKVHVDCPNGSCPIEFHDRPAA